MFRTNQITSSSDSESIRYSNKQSEQNSLTTITKRDGNPSSTSVTHSSHKNGNISTNQQNSQPQGSSSSQTRNPILHGRQQKTEPTKRQYYRVVVGKRIQERHSESSSPEKQPKALANINKRRAKPEPVDTDKVEPNNKSTLRERQKYALKTVHNEKNNKRMTQIATRKISFGSRRKTCDFIVFEKESAAVSFRKNIPNKLVEVKGDDDCDTDQEQLETALHVCKKQLWQALCMALVENGAVANKLDDVPTRPGKVSPTRSISIHSRSEKRDNGMVRRNSSTSNVVKKR